MASAADFIVNVIPNQPLAANVSENQIITLGNNMIFGQVSMDVQAISEHIMVNM